MEILKYCVYAVAALSLILLIKHMSNRAADRAAIRTIESRRQTEITQGLDAAIAAEDFRAIEKQIANAETEAREQAIDYLCDNESGHDCFARWAEAEPEDSLSQLVYGANLVAKAWQIRGGSLGSQVSTANALGFHATLDLSQSALEKTERLDPQQARVHKFLINAAMGRGQRARAEEIFQRARKLAPARLDYHLAMLTLLTNKWGGSHDTMFEFARNEGGDDERGCLPALLAHAHTERWLAYRLEQNFKGFRDHFHDSDNRDEIVRAFARLPESPGDYLGIREHRLADNLFAFCFLQMEQKDKAKALFERIDLHYARLPWTYLGESAAVAFLQHRRKAGLSPSGFS